MKKFVKMTLLIVFALVSCGKSTTTLEGTPIKITGEIAPMTKAIETGFEQNDAFSAYITENGTFGTDVKYENLKYTKGAAEWNPEQAIFWKNGSQPIWIWGIYPYQSIAVTASPITFVVQNDQSSRESETKLSGYESSDLLLAYQGNIAPTEKVITLTFTHALSKISIELVSDILDVTAGATVKINNVVLSSSIDLTTKKVTPNDNSIGRVIACNAEGAFYKAIVQPSSVKDLTFSVEIGGMLYEKSFGDKVFLEGTQYNFKLTLKQGSMDINGGDIGDWIDGGNTDTNVKPS